MPHCIVTGCGFTAGNCSDGWLVGWLGFNGISALTAQIGYNHAKNKVS